MARHDESPTLRSDLRASIADGTAYSVMVGIGEAYLPAFVLAVGLGEVRAGLTATIPVLAGSVLQLAAPALIRRLGSHRRWVLICGCIQAAVFLPLLAAAIGGRIPWPVVVLIATFYWGAALGAGPAWNTWMARLVPLRLRAPFFARRSLMSQLGILVGLMAAGFLLSGFAGRGTPLTGFALIFSVACACRLISLGFLVKQHEPQAPPEPEQRVSLPALWRRLRRRDGHLLAYMLGVQAMSNLAAPFFTPYMLHQLALPYATYMGLLGVAFIAKAATLLLLGRFTQRFGAKRLLWIGGAGVVPLSALWIVSAAPAYLAGIQVLAGIIWACYELATFLLLFEMIADRERTSILTSFNLVNSLAIAAGSVAGGLILRWAGQDRAAYMLLFLLSAIGRVFTLLLLHRVAGVPRVPTWIRFRTLGVRPAAESIDRPILATIPECREGEDAAGAGGQ